MSVHTGGFLSSSLTRSVDYFNPTFSAPQLTPKQFLIISSPSEQKIVPRPSRDLRRGVVRSTRS